MLQTYKIVPKGSVDKLQVEILYFFKQINGAIPTDSFDPDIHLPSDLAKKAKKKVTKVIKGVKTKVDNEFYTKLKGFFDKYKALGVVQSSVDNMFQEMNNIKDLLNKSQKRICLSDLPKNIQTEAKGLFLYLYENTLSTYGIKKHYESFCNLQENIWCPFCGMETLEDFTFIKEDYDHLLAKSIYPFAAVNMRNLAPICKKCNRTHKKAKDLIWDGVNQIRAINPYNSKLRILVDFSGTTLPTSHNKKGTWSLKVIPAREEVIRWNYVYDIADRITKNYFTRGKRPDIETWITDFISIHDLNPGITTTKELREALKKYGQTFELEHFKEGRYVKASTFKWISQKASSIYIQSILKSIQRV